ncbi:unnamed protein product [Diplocarpon coronariae]
MALFKLLATFPQLLITLKGIINISEFKSSLRSIGITLKLVLTKAHYSISKVERYYRPLRRAFEIIIAKHPRLSDDKRLQIAIKAPIGHHISVYLTTKEEGESQFTLKGNILYYSSTKYKRVIRAVLAFELYTIIAGIDILVSIAITINIVIAKLSLPCLLTIIYTDSLSLYKYIIKLGIIKEKRLIIDIIAI